MRKFRIAKLPVAHVRGLILVFFPLGPISKFMIPEDPSMMTFLYFDTVPKKFLYYPPYF